MELRRREPFDRESFNEFHFDSNAAMESRFVPGDPAAMVEYRKSAPLFYLNDGIYPRLFKLMNCDMGDTVIDTLYEDMQLPLINKDGVTFYTLTIPKGSYTPRALAAYLSVLLYTHGWMPGNSERIVSLQGVDKGDYFMNFRYPLLNSLNPVTEASLDLTESKSRCFAVSIIFDKSIWLRPNDRRFIFQGYMPTTDPKTGDPNAFIPSGAATEADFFLGQGRLDFKRLLGLNADRLWLFGDQTPNDHEITRTSFGEHATEFPLNYIALPYDYLYLHSNLQSAAVYATTATPRGWQNARDIIARIPVVDASETQLVVNALIEQNALAVDSTRLMSNMLLATLMQAQTIRLEFKALDTNTDCFVRRSAPDEPVSLIYFYLTIPPTADEIMYPDPRSRYDRVFISPSSFSGTIAWVGLV